MGVRERTRDIATLRAMGFRARRVVLLVLTESAFLGFASAALGVLAAPPLVRGFLKAVESQFGQMPTSSVRPQTLMLAAAAALLVSLLAGVLPALRAVRIPIAEGLRKVA
jgi:putative ABC transport system permease protein